MLNESDGRRSEQSDRKVLVVTSGRSDASPLKHVIEHLGKNAEVHNIGGGPRMSVDRAMQAIQISRPDIMVLLGDRFESMGAAYAATYRQTPIAHIHGGEHTLGSMDNAFRHAISKMSHIHLVANYQAKDTLVRMGEENIYITGAPGLDAVQEIIDEGLRKPEKYFVVTLHPDTLGGDSGVNSLIKALKQFPDYGVYWTSPNGDPGRNEIMRAFRVIEFRFGDWTHEEYLRKCRHAACVIGNSSSGIIEAPYLEVPTVNIGERQDGRQMANSIITADIDADTIKTAIKMALSDSSWNPGGIYGHAGASKRIAEIIAGHDLNNILRKSWLG